MSNNQVYIQPAYVDGAIRATSGTDVLEVCWAAGAQAQHGPVSVEFKWYLDDVLQLTETVTTQRIIRPRFANGGLQPGAIRGNGLTPDSYFVASKPASTFAEGIVRIDAKVMAGAFSYTFAEPTRLINHRAGATMPCSLVYFVDTVAGSNSNNGLGWNTAFATVNKAIETAAGIGADLAGCVINVRGRVNGWQFGDWRTSAPGWLHIIGHNGARLDVVNADFGNYASGTDSMRMGDAAVPGVCRVHFKNFLALGTAPASFGAVGISRFIWADNCTFQSKYWRPGTNPTVRWMDDNGIMFGTNDGAASPQSTYFTGCVVRGKKDGLEKHRLALDCEIDGFLGTGIYHLNTTTSATMSTTWHNQRNVPGETNGYIRLPDPFPGTGVELVAWVPLPNYLVVFGPTNKLGILSDLIELSHVDGVRGSANPYFGLRIAGFATGAINGTRKVFFAGVHAGRAYAVFEANGIAIPGGLETASAGQMYTAKLLDGLGTEYWYIHSDGVYLQGNRTRDVVRSSGDYNCVGLIPLFANGQGVGDVKQSVWISNSRFGGHPEDASNGFGSNWNDSYIEKSAFSAQLQFSPSPYVHAGARVQDTICRSQGGLSAGNATSLTWNKCRVILTSTAALGLTSTNGPAWSTDPLQPPYSMKPLLPLLTGGSSATYTPTHWAHMPGSSTIGPARNVALLNWEADFALGDLA